MRDWLGTWTDAVGYHHERWDGKGYPHGLAGEEIPLAGRIVAVADVFDVITSARSYKQASAAEDGRTEIARCAGTQFDPTRRAGVPQRLARADAARDGAALLARPRAAARPPAAHARLRDACRSAQRRRDVGRRRPDRPRHRRPCSRSVRTSAHALVPNATTGCAKPFVVRRSRARHPQPVVRPPHPPPAGAGHPAAPHPRVAPSRPSRPLTRSPPPTTTRRFTRRLGSCRRPRERHRRRAASTRSVSSPAHGAATIAGTRVLYRAPTSFRGNDSLQYRAADASGTTATATVAVDILPVNHAPSFCRRRRCDHRSRTRPRRA